MTQQDLDYRIIHAVVPQLDFNIGGYDNIVAPPVQYTKYATMRGGRKVNVGKVVDGALGVTEGVLGLATGNWGYAIGKIFSSTAKTATGAYDGDYAASSKEVSDTIKLFEEDSWKYRYFLNTFIAAPGYLGQIVCEHGEYSNTYNGNGHRFFENGDYFEGRFINGRIGNGIYLFANGNKYLGGFNDRLEFEGLGTLIYADGTGYYGAFKNGKREELGIMWYTDGVYVGHWLNNMRHNHGFLRLEDEKFYDGNFFEDKMVDQ